MKKLLNKVNGAIVLALSAMGFSNASVFEPEEPIVCGYGVPHAEFEVTGKVTDTKSKPLPNIQVTVRNDRGPYQDGMTKEDGSYMVGGYEDFPTDSLEIIAEDPSGVYASDTVRVKVTYEQSADNHDHWNQGTAYVQQDFKLKKRPCR